MSFTLRHQLTTLDRSIASLLDERARLVREAAATTSGATVPGAAIDDLLARASGDFPAPALRAVFAAADEGCRSAALGGRR